jgi:hypothetical protein
MILTAGIVAGPFNFCLYFIIDLYYNYTILGKT